MRRISSWVALAATSLLSSAQATAADVHSAPSVAMIRKCIQQIDTTGKRRFAWKEVTVESPRPPRDNYEAMDLWGWSTPLKTEGYPIHVVYNFDGLADIDTYYWIVRNQEGKWQIPLLCSI
jgi:hypothetical protein